jgi:hypothetical protein
MLVIRLEAIQVFSLSVARTPIFKTTKTLLYTCWFLGGQSKDFGRIQYLQNIKTYTRVFVKLIHDFHDFRLPPRPSGTIRSVGWEFGEAFGSHLKGLGLLDR